MHNIIIVANLCFTIVIKTLAFSLCSLNTICTQYTDRIESLAFEKTSTLAVLDSESRLSLGVSSLSFGKLVDPVLPPFTNM